MAKRAKRKPARATGSASADLTHIAEDLRPLAVPMGELRLDARNARTHDERNIRAIAASLRQFGQLKPIVVQRATGTIEAGNGTYLAAQSLGWTHLAAVRVDHDPAAATGFAVADNRTAELAAWDQTVLQQLLGEIEGQQPDLYEALLLAELAPSPEPPAAGAGDGEGGPQFSATYQLMVACTDEGDQHRLSRQMRKDGRSCRRIVLTPDVQP